MTLLLGIIAVVLLIVVIGATVTSVNRDQPFNAPLEGGTLPAGALIATPAAAQANFGIEPTTVAYENLDDLLAKKETDAIRARETASSEFMPGNLGVGTKLVHQGNASTIVGVVSFDFDGQLWQDYVVEDPTGTWWRFGVEPDRGYRLAAFAPTSLPVAPGPDQLLYNGEQYVVTEKGIANYRSAGRTNTFDEGRYHYFDYENTNGAILSFEQFDGGVWQTSVGHRVNPAAVSVTNNLTL